MDISKLNTYEKEQLAQNANTPVAELAALAKDDDYRVRCWVAQNPNSPIEALAALANDDDSGVRYYVASNPNSPIETLAAILQLELRGNWRKDTLRLVFNHRNSTDTIKAIIKTVWPGVQ